MKRADYVYGAGPLGFGHYHLLTRESYVILYNRLANEAPIPCCACTKMARQELSEHDDARIICYNRSVASIPDDAQGAKEAEEIARGVAKATYEYTQNEQLVLGAIGAVAGANVRL
eukprot:7485668-Ditylum_brightwellii.AAC.1